MQLHRWPVLRESHPRPASAQHECRIWTGATVTSLAFPRSAPPSYLSSRMISVSPCLQQVNANIRCHRKSPSQDRWCSFRRPHIEQRPNDPRGSKPSPRKPVRGKCVPASHACFRQDGTHKYRDACSCNGPRRPRRHVYQPLDGWRRQRKSPGFHNRWRSEQREREHFHRLQLLPLCARTPASPMLHPSRHPDTLDGQAQTGPQFHIHQASTRRTVPVPVFPSIDRLH
mmetsp:Transcript_49397/g.131066  ORF Transcript_49397/g.131066 Transcript_49397/m.131066 type:complete len:228 (-) Transcript_49397:136-819(-)